MTKSDLSNSEYTTDSISVQSADDVQAIMRDLHKQAGEHRQPLYGTFELTNRCNLSCQMCFVRQPQHEVKLRSNELSSSVWLALARAAKENGMIFLLLTGGEVFLRPDFFEIYAPLTRMGFIIVIYSNGTLINEEIASKLAEFPPSHIEITLYGSSAEVFEAVTGVRGSYQRCISGINLLLQKNIPVRLKTTLTKHNIGELQTMQKMALNWGVQFSAGWLLTKRRDGEKSSVEEWRLSPTDCVELEADDDNTVKRWASLNCRTSPDNVENFYCQAGKTVFVINPYGEMNPCIELTQPASLPLKIGFQSAWKQLCEFVDNSPPLCQTCKTCDVRVYCPRCPAWSLLENKTMTDPVPYLCEIAQQRKQFSNHFDRHSK